MTDGPLLTGLHLGPRLSLRLQASLVGTGMARAACSVSASRRRAECIQINLQHATALPSSLCSSETSSLPAFPLLLSLQSDFASHSVPLDIRAAADLHSQQQQRAPGWQGWQWPWQRREPQALLLQGKQAVVLPRPSQQLPQRQAEAQHGLRWWDWGSPSAGR